MNVTHIEHIGIAVRDLDAAIALYETVFGLRCDGIEEVADQQVRTAVFRVGDTKIELLASTSADGPVARFLTRRGEGIHHVAFAVGDVDAALREAEARGIRLIDNRPRTGAEGLAVAFLHPASTRGVLMELCGPPAGAREVSRKESA